MPINDPIGSRKVAPASLAFETRRQGGTVMFGGDAPDVEAPVYQTTINLFYQPRFNIYQTVQGAKLEAQRILRNVSDAEHRAKHYVGDWHHCLEWDSDAIAQPWFSSSANIGALTKLRFNNEVLRAMGAQQVQGSNWRFDVADDATGDWHFDVFSAMRFSPNDKIASARLVMLLNGQVWRHIDLMNSHFNDKAHIEEIVLQGSCIVPLRAGDYVEAGVYLFDEGGPGTGSLTATTNYYAYITGHRVSCTPSYINLPTTGASFDNAV